MVELDLLHGDVHVVVADEDVLQRRHVAEVEVDTWAARIVEHGLALRVFLAL